MPLSQTKLAILPSIPAGHISFILEGDGVAKRIAEWAPSAFLISDAMAQCLLYPDLDTVAALMQTTELPTTPTGLFANTIDPNASCTPALDLRFISVRDGGKSLLRIAASHEGRRSLSLASWCIIQATDMALAGEVVQDLLRFLNITNVTSLRANFPLEFERVSKAMQRVADCQAVRGKLSAEMAECVGTAKLNIVQAEDARMRSDMRSMRAAYARLRGANAELLREHRKRALNHAQLIEALREVNTFIQRAAGLRVGEQHSSVIAACRAAVRSGSIGALLQAAEGDLA